VYDEQAKKFKYINTVDAKAAPRFVFPLDSLDAIEWPDNSLSSGKQVALN
jgi:hypothetical protein